MYHLRCFTCSVCAKQLSTGEVLYLQPGEDNTLLCKDDYLKNNGGTAGESQFPTESCGQKCTHRVFSPDCRVRLCRALGPTRLVKAVSCLNVETLRPRPTTTTTTQRAHLEPRNVPLLRAGVPHISLSSQIALRSISPLLSPFSFFRPLMKKFHLLGRFSIPRARYHKTNCPSGGDHRPLGTPSTGRTV